MSAPPILYADDRFVVLNKPAGLKVHPGPGGGASVEDWFPALSRRRAGPWLAHRLDADTAGCLLVALRRAALHEAQAAFAAGQVEKVYWAAVRGGPADAGGVIDVPIAKQVTPSGWRMAPDPAGAAAVTAWRVLGRSGAATWLELRPRTGRTHQIRVHCAASGWPLLGDPIYGAGDGRLQLLARRLRVPGVPPLEATAPVPVHMEAALARCGWPGPGAAC